VIRVFRVLKSNRGLSLMELLVAGLMFAMLAATVIMVISPIMMAFSRANSLAEYNTVLDSVGNVIVSDFAGARSISSSGVDELVFSTDSGSVEFSVVNGYLHRRFGTAPSAPVFPAGFYDGKTISFDVSGDELAGFEITVTVIPSGRPGSATAEITRNFAIRPLMLG